MTRIANHLNVIFMRVLSLLEPKLSNLGRSTMRAWAKFEGWTNGIINDAWSSLPSALKRNGRRFADDIVKCIPLNESFTIQIYS